MKPLLLTALAAHLSCAATLHLKVVEDHTGAPVSSAEIQFARDGQRELIADLETDAQGRFQLDGQPIGDYTATVLRKNHLTASLRFHVSDVGFSATVRLIRCAAIGGQVSSFGQALEFVRVIAMPRPVGGGPVQRDSEHNHFAHPDERGEYRIYDMPPGEYLLAMDWGVPGTGGNQKGFQFYPDNAHPQIFRLQGGEERRNVNLAVSAGPPAAVKGTVPPPAEGTRYALSLVLVDQPSWVAAEVSTKPDGSFNFDGIAPGTYEILAAQGTIGGRGGTRPIPGGMFARARITVGGSNVEGISLEPTKGRQVTFQLRAAPGPERGACPSSAQLDLSAYEAWAHSNSQRSIAVSLDKPETLTNLPPAHYLITLSGLGDQCYSAATTVLDLSGSASPGLIALPITPAGAIRGKASGSADIAIVLWPADASEPESVVRTAYPDADGRFAFSALKPGLYRIAAVTAALASSSKAVFDPAHMQEVHVAGGMTVEVDL